MSKSRTTVTSIRVDPTLIEAVRDQGVGNLSQLVSGLLKDWLKEVAEEDESSARKVAQLRAELEDVRKEWDEYVKKKNSECSREEVLSDEE